MMKKILVILFVAFLVSCSKDKIEIDPSNLLLGTWQYSGWSENVSVYLRGNEFTDSPCFRFNADGTLTERKNSGFCGTPPITYADYTGSWRIINDSLILVNVGYWGGTTTYHLDIETVSESLLKLKFIYSTE